MLNNPRLVYRVILKVLLSFAVLLLIIVFLNSLFIATPDDKSSHLTQNKTIELDLRSMNAGETRKIRWQSKEVIIFKRDDEKVFTYFNTGDSGNCPLFKEPAGFKDICTGTRFDFKGRSKGDSNQSVILKSPPYYLLGDTLIIGVSQKK